MKFRIGKHVTPLEEYQRKFACFFGVERAFAFWKGRVALYALLRALSIGEGDEVILPGYTCVVDVNPIKYVGAKPVYVDIEPDTFNMDVSLLEKKITEYTKVIVAQHTYGYPCEMDTIMNIARSNGIFVIEDCCHTFGSKYKDRIVGTFGQAAYFSFQWNKPYTTGLGGMLITRDQELAERIKSLQAYEVCFPSGRELFMLWIQMIIYRLFVYPRTTAFAQNLFRYLTQKGAVVGSSDTSEFKPVKAGDFLKCMSKMQARSGRRQLGEIEGNICHRRKMAQLYDELLVNRGWQSRKYDRGLAEPTMVRYPVRIHEKKKALAQAAKAGIELGSWFESPLHPIETCLASYDYELGMCPEAEKAANQVVNLPLHSRVNTMTVEKSVNFITGFTQVV